MSALFLTLTPNPCLERTFSLPSLNHSVQRVASEAIFVSAGGKGLNSARVAARFGARVIATGPVGRRQSAYLRELAAGEGVTSDWVEVEADTRVCLNFLHGEAQKTEIIEAGRAFSIVEGEALLEKWDALLEGADLAAIGGSYPPSDEEMLLNHGLRSCQSAAKAGVPLLYDGRGVPFERALVSRTPPWAIKPNREEAQQILSRNLETVAEEIAAVREFRRLGVEVVLMSCGWRGLYLGIENEVEWIPAPRVETVSAVGSGDALVGAFAAQFLQNGDVFEAARWGVAAGSANAAQAKPAFVTREDAARLWPVAPRARREEF